MDSQALRFKWRKVLEKLKSKYKADINKAEIAMTLLAKEKNEEYGLNTENPNEAGFKSALTNIRFKVALLAWVDPDHLRDSLDDEFE